MDVKDEGTIPLVVDGSWGLPGALDKIEAKIRAILEQGRTAVLDVKVQSRKQ